MKTKKNIFGYKDITAEKNLMVAITEEEQQIGIAPWHREKMIGILRGTLSPYYFDLIDRGFGITRPRQSQKEIAEELAMKDNAVSVNSHKAIEKLQKPAVRKQLEALMPSAEELFEMVETLKKETTGSKQLKEAQYRLKSANAALEKIREAVKELEDELASVIYEKGVVEKRNNALQQEVERLKQEKALDDALLAKRQESFKQIVEHANCIIETISAERESLLALTGSKLIVNLEDLELSEDIKRKMKNVGINSLTALLGLTMRSLIKMIGKDNAIKVESTLSRQGLHLKVAS